MNRIYNTTRNCAFIKQVLLLAFFSASLNAQQLRIISTDAGITDIIIALGVEKELVGVDVTSEVPDHLNVAKLGYHRSLSTEGILSLNPNMIIGSEYMGPPAAIKAISKAELTLLRLPKANNEHTLKSNINKISASINKMTQAEPLLNHIDKKMEILNKLKLPENTSIAFLLQMEGRNLSLAGTDTSGHDFIALLGGKNLGEHRGYHSVTAESLINLKPDIIIVASRNMSLSPIQKLLKQHPLIVHTPAGQEHKIIAVDGKSLVAGISVASIDALAQIGQQLQRKSQTQSVVN